VFVSIKKRNGSIVPFRADKITTAIARAGRATDEFDEEASGRLTLRVLNLAQQALPGSIPSVEQIQDIVEEVLISSQFRATAKAYIIYREQHARIREIVSRADVDLIDKYLDRADWQVNENSNMAYSLQGLNNYVSSETHEYILGVPGGNGGLQPRLPGSALRRRRQGQGVHLPYPDLQHHQ
jgi:ribonucleoside-triphosphate reductase